MFGLYGFRMGPTLTWPHFLKLILTLENAEYLKMAEQYQLEKNLWTDADFEKMSWHDCPIHAIFFRNDCQLLLDIDYIFKWVLMKNKKHFQFWIAPCTLIFDNVYNIQFESTNTNLIIDSICRESPRVPENAEYINKDTEYDWIIETTVGEISFTSVGYTQYVRNIPTLLRTQSIDMLTRGGISFDTSFSAQG
jgi:hypothetical protein